MKVRSLTAFEVPIPLRKAVRHASHVRYHNDTLIVRCELDDGSVGWGEGLPRPYVTGETMDSAWQHLTQTSFEPLASPLTDPRDAVDRLDQLSLASVTAPPGVVPRECFGNAVRCALELAVLDACCRSSGCSLGDLLTALPEGREVLEPSDEVSYSGAVTSLSRFGQWQAAWKMRLFGFRTVKVKVGAVGIDDVDCLRRVRRIVGPHVDIRLDANEAWDAGEVIARMEPLLEYGPTSLEQPVPHAQCTGLAAVRRELDVPVMLDESLCSSEDADRAIAAEACDLFNLRLSKCGGIVRSLRLAAQAVRSGLGYQLGCQIGETGILSAAGRHFACNVGRIRYLEGSYDRFLVRETLTLEDLTFRRGGRAPRLNGPGLGVTVNESRVRDLAVRTEMLIR